MSHSVSHNVVTGDADRRAVVTVYVSNGPCRVAIAMLNH